MFILASAHAFSFGDLTKKVSDVASAITEDDSVKSLTAKQETALAKYKSSKEDFLRGFSIAAGAMGADDLKKRADSALATVESQKAKTLDVEAVAKAADDVLAAAKTEAVKAVAGSNSTVAAAADAKQQYDSAMGYFKSGLSGELEAAQSVADVAKETKEAMAKADTTQRIKIAAALKPSLDLAQTIPQDISKSKEAVSEILKKVKASGASIPGDLLSLIK